MKSAIYFKREHKYLPPPSSFEDSCLIRYTRVNGVFKGFGFLASSMLKHDLASLSNICTISGDSEKIYKQRLPRSHINPYVNDY